MGTKHTPGPWEAVGLAVHADNGREIIFGQHNTRSGEKGERKANAHLIAAAPDLLAALRDMLDATTDDCGDALSLGIAQTNARYAIAKAEGGQL